MALSPEQIHTLVDLHRKNATLEAELSQANNSIRLLEASNRILLQQMCASSQFRGQGEVGWKAQQPACDPTINHTYEAKLFPSAELKQSTPQLFKQEDAGDGLQSALQSHPLQNTRLARDTPPKPDFDSDADDELPDRNDRKLINIVENPHAPRFMAARNCSGFKRTVLITKLPFSMSLKELVARVSGGLVVSIKLLDTASITKSRSALVVFFEENSAINFVRHCSQKPICVSDAEVKVDLVPTPTVPVPPPTYHNIINYGATRCIIINKCPVHLSLSHIRIKLSPREHPDLHGILDMHEVR